MSDGEPAQERSSARWHVLAAGFLCYAFDAVDFMMLAPALPMIIAEWHLTLAEAGLIGTAGMLGVVAARAAGQLLGDDALAPFALGSLAGRVGLAAAIGLCALGFLLAGVVTLAMPDNPRVPGTEAKPT